jgi:hypothetical protein
MLRGKKKIAYIFTDVFSSISMAVDILHMFYPIQIEQMLMFAYLIQGVIQL